MSIQNKLSLELKTKQDLQTAYMPFILHGGLFVQTETEHVLGEEVTVLFTFMQEETLTFKAKIIWITPKYAQHELSAGVGVQLSADDFSLKEKIENYLQAKEMSHAS